jgi:hypothetical protein
LPPEILPMISEYLCYADILSLRTTCTAHNKEYMDGALHTSGAVIVDPIYEEDPFPILEKLIGHTFMVKQQTDIIDYTKLHALFRTIQSRLHTAGLLGWDLSILQAFPTLVFPKRAMFQYVNDERNVEHLFRIPPTMYPAFEHVEKLTICQNYVDGEMFAAFLASAQAQQITKLTISPTTANHTETLVAILNLPNLTRLTIVCKHAGEDDDTSAHKFGLDLDACRIIGEALPHLKLTKLHLRKCYLNTSHIHVILRGLNYGMSKCTKITSFKIDRNNIGYSNTSCDIWDLIECMPNLEILDLCNNIFDSGHEGIVDCINTLHHLKKLTIGSNDFDANLVARIVCVLPSTMEQLYTHGCICTDSNMAFAKAMCELMGRCPRLWGLGMNGNMLSIRTIITIARNVCPTMRDIGITHGSLTDAAISIIGYHLHARCPQLRYVYLYNVGYKSAKKVTEDGYTVLQRRIGPDAVLIKRHLSSRYIKHV